MKRREDEKMKRRGDEEARKRDSENTHDLLPFTLLLPAVSIRRYANLECEL
jgi:hypothetical protein